MKKHRRRHVIKGDAELIGPHFNPCVTSPQLTSHSVEKVESFSFKIRNKTRVSTLTTPRQHRTKS